MSGRNFDLKEQIRAYWSGRAAAFDDSPSHKIEDQYGKPCWQALLRQAAGLSQNDDMQGMTALDIACGTGEISRMLCSLGAEVTGLDFSVTMHAIATAKLADANWSPLLCDAEQLSPIADHSFDLITTRHLAWTLTNPLTAYGEWYRVLKPGGRALIIDGNWMAPASWQSRTRKWLANIIEPAAPRSAEDQAADTAIRRQLPYANGLSQAQLITDMTAQGFVLIGHANMAQIYTIGMRGHGIATRLRMTHEHRYGLILEKPRR